MAALEAEAYIVQMQVQAAAVCLEMQVVQELDLSRHLPVQQEAVCLRQVV